MADRNPSIAMHNSTGPHRRIILSVEAGQTGERLDRFMAAATEVSGVNLSRTRLTLSPPQAGGTVAKAALAPGSPRPSAATRLLQRAPACGFPPFLPSFVLLRRMDEMRILEGDRQGNVFCCG